MHTRCLRGSNAACHCPRAPPAPRVRPAATRPSPACAANDQAAQPSGSNRVELWKEALQAQDNRVLQTIGSELLVAEPAALCEDPREVLGCIELLLKYTHSQQLYSATPLVLPFPALLSLQQHFTAQGLAHALAALDAAVTEALDRGVTGADLLVAAAPNITPLLEAPQGALGRRAAALASLIPEFLPSSVLRAIPELLYDWSNELDESCVARAGDVVVVGRGVRAVLLPAGAADPGGGERSSGSPGWGGQAASSVAQLSMPGSKVAIYSVPQGGPGAAQQAGEGAGEELLDCVLNSRVLIFVAHEAEGRRQQAIRYEDPYRHEEALMCVGAGEPAGAGAGGRNSTGTPKASFVEQQASQSRTWLMWPTQHTAKQ